MTDRELLEMAAKAAGMELDYSIRPDGKAFYHPDRNAMALADGGWFSPLTDDGDALRLAVKLHIEFVVDSFDARVTYVPRGQHPMAEGFDEIYEDASADPYAATRRAIVRAAASIGSHSGLQKEG